jgi:F0F1-type ATP synthase assembly protein I
MNQDPDQLKKGSNKFYKEIGPYIGLGLQLAITVTVMVFLGLWLDGFCETEPILTVVFSFLGVFAGLYTFIKSALKADK